MERIKIFKAPSGYIKFFLWFGALFTLLGISVTVKSLLTGFDNRFPSGDWAYVLFTFQGVLFMVMGYSNLRGRRFFIEWDNDEIRFLLPGKKEIERIRFDQVDSVGIGLFEIRLTMKDQMRTIGLDNLQFEDIRKVKALFENYRNKRHMNN